MRRKLDFRLHKKGTFHQMPKVPRRIRARQYLFTIYDQPKEWLEAWQTRGKDGWHYVVAQLERCPTTGRDHVQGYIQLDKAEDLKVVQKKYLRPNCHVEVPGGTPQQNKVYCTKDETKIGIRIERGTMSEQGDRNDLVKMAEELKAGVPLELVADHNPAQFIRLERGLRAYATMVQRPLPRNKPNVYYLWGRPGCGKSRIVASRFEKAYFATDTKQGWFDGYTGEKTVVFDDFEGNFPLKEMLRLLDYGPLRLQVKGGWVNIKADTFIFTSNTAPEFQYKGDPAWTDRVVNKQRYGSTVIAEPMVKRIYDCIFNGSILDINEIEANHAFYALFFAGENHKW